MWIQVNPVLISSYLVPNLQIVLADHKVVVYSLRILRTKITFGLWILTFRNVNLWIHHLCTLDFLTHVLQPLQCSLIIFKFRTII